MSRRLSVWAVAAGAVLSLLGTTSATGTPVVASAFVVGATQPNGESVVPVISASGRYVVFPRRVSLGPGGRQARGPSGSHSPTISADGRYVAFESDATNLEPGDTNSFEDVFVRDRVAKVT